MKTSSAKAKGRKLQQAVRDLIITTLKPWGIVAEDVKSTSMGAGGEDVQLSPLARSFLPISIECKSHKSFAVYNVMDQAIENCPEGCEPVVVLKANNRKPVVVVDMEHYFWLQQEKLVGENHE